MLFFSLVILSSCNRIKRKGQAVADKTEKKIADTKQKISKKKDQLVDKVFPAYDSGKPDTESSKKRFTEHLQINRSNDVKNIYAYGDFMGINYTVLLSFTCDDSTINRIVERKAMTLAGTDDGGLYFSSKLSWWNDTVISKIQPYKAGKDYEYWQYLWYNKKIKTAYYEEFSL